MKRLLQISTDTGGTLTVNHDTSDVAKPLHLVVDRPGFAAIGIRLTYDQWQQVSTAVVAAAEGN